MKISKLNTIIKVKKNLENLQAQKLLEIKKELLLLKEKKEEKQKIMYLLASQLGFQLDISIIKNSISFLEKLKNEIKQIDKEIIEKQNEFEIQKEKLLNATKDRKRFEEYKKMLQERLNLETERMERAFIDEMSTILYSRRINGD